MRESRAQRAGPSVPGCLAADTAICIVDPRAITQAMQVGWSTAVHGSEAASCGASAEPSLHL
jgi:hypothetical protein